MAHRQIGKVNSFCATVLLVGVAGCALQLSSPAAAASSVEETTAPNAGPDAGEILVTARGRSEKASKVPDSLVVLGDTMIQSLGIKQAGDLGRTLPNIGFKQDLSVTSSFISVRGITSARNTDPAVSLVIDGVQAASASQIRQQLFDIEQIEVLKGPQGALYGRNAIGGAINVVTKKPSNTLEGHGEFSLGNAGAFEGAVSFSGPIIEDVLLFRVSGFFHDDNGQIVNTTVGKKVDFKTNKTARARLLFTPNSDLEVDLKYNHDQYKGGASYHAVVRNIGAPFPVNDPQSNSNNFSFSPVSAPIAVNYATIDDASASVHYELPFATLSSITAWSHTKERYGLPGEGIGGSGPGDLDFLAPPILGFHQTFNIKAWSQEVRLTSPSSGALRWQMGAYYTGIKRLDTLPVYINDGVHPLEDTTIYLFPNGTKRKINAYAFFGQAEYDVTDKLTVTAALRYDHEHRTQLDLDDLASGTRKVNFKLATPKFSIAYKPNRENMLYATVARGFRSGGFNTPRTAFGAVFGQEEVWSYEAGYKGNFMNRMLNVTAAVFYEDIKNKAEFVFDAATAAQVIYNIPKSRVYGFELELKAQPTQGLTLSAAGGIMSSKIKEFDQGALFPTPQLDAAIIGNHLPQFSHWTLSLAADYDGDIGRGWKVKLHTDYSLRGDNYWDVTNRDKEKNVGLLAASIGVGRDNWELSLFGTNLTNTKYWTQFFNQDTAGIPDVGYPAERRRYGIRARVTF